MGKLYNDLQRQLRTAYKKEAEDCIKIYNKLKGMNKNDGSVWSKDWEALTVMFGCVGSYPNSFMVYRPSEIGKVFLNGIKFEERMKESAEQSDDVL